MNHVALLTKAGAEIVHSPISGSTCNLADLGSPALCFRSHGRSAGAPAVVDIGWGHDVDHAVAAGVDQQFRD
jgi:hypothetical protein